MLPVERVIGEEGLRADADGLRLAARLPWYRSLPLSTIEIGALEIDGEAVDLATVRFELDGQSWTLAELADATNAFWFVLDSAQLLVPGRVVAPGSEHRVGLTINVYPPYIPGMKRTNPQVAVLRAQ